MIRKAGEAGEVPKDFLIPSPNLNYEGKTSRSAITLKFRVRSRLKGGGGQKETKNQRIQKKP